MIHYFTISVFRRSFLYLCILGALGLVSCTSCKQKNAGPLGQKETPGAGRIKEPDREEETELELVFSNLTSTTAQGSPSSDCFDIELKNNGSKPISLAKLKLGYKADLERTYHGGHETGDAHQDQFIIVQAGSRNDVHDMTLEALTGQPELAAGASVVVNTSVETGEAVASATTQLKVTETEANKTLASQAFNFAKTAAESTSEATEESSSEREEEAKAESELPSRPLEESTISAYKSHDDVYDTLKASTGQAGLVADANVTLGISETGSTKALSPVQPENKPKETILLQAATEKFWERVKRTIKQEGGYRKLLRRIFRRKSQGT